MSFKLKSFVVFLKILCKLCDFPTRMLGHHTAPLWFFRLTDEKTTEETGELFWVAGMEEGTAALLSYGRELSESDPASMEDFQGFRSSQEC